MRVFSSASIALVLIACGGSKEPASSPTPQPPAPAPAATVEAKAEPAPASAAEAKAAPAKPEAPKPVLRYTGFATPESVLYDAARDRYLVSNIQGRPVDADGNGFISVLSPEGTVTTLKWIEGGKNKVTLNAPKGMAIAKDVLYVADLDTVRTFDVKTGAPKAAIAIPGATFLNDVTADDAGKVYVSDSGMKMEGSDFKPTGTDAVWVIEGGKARALAKGEDLGRPNGLLADGGSVYVATFAKNDLYKLDAKGKKSEGATLPKGSLDGVLKVGDTFYVSSWESETIYKGKLGGTFEPMLTQLKAPADIGFDTKRSRILVPRFMDDAVEVYDVK